MKANLQKS